MWVTTSLICVQIFTYCYMLTIFQISDLPGSPNIKEPFFFFFLILSLSLCCFVIVNLIRENSPCIHFPFLFYEEAVSLFIYT